MRCIKKSWKTNTQLTDLMSELKLISDKKKVRNESSFEGSALIKVPYRATCRPVSQVPVRRRRPPGWLTAPVKRVSHHVNFFASNFHPMHFQSEKNRAPFHEMDPFRRFTRRHQVQLAIVQVKKMQCHLIPNYQHFRTVTLTKVDG